MQEVCRVQEGPKAAVETNDRDDGQDDVDEVLDDQQHVDVVELVERVRLVAHVDGDEHGHTPFAPT